MHPFLPPSLTHSVRARPFAHLKAAKTHSQVATTFMASSSKAETSTMSFRVSSYAAREAAATAKLCCRIGEKRPNRTCDPGRCRAVCSCEAHGHTRARRIHILYNHGKRTYKGRGLTKAEQHKQNPWNAQVRRKGLKGGKHGGQT